MLLLVILCVYVAVVEASITECRTLFRKVDFDYDFGSLSRDDFYEGLGDCDILEGDCWAGMRYVADWTQFSGKTLRIVHGVEDPSSFSEDDPDLIIANLYGFRVTKNYLGEYDVRIGRVFWNDEEMPQHISTYDYPISNASEMMDSLNDAPKGVFSVCGDFSELEDGACVPFLVRKEVDVTKRINFAKKTIEDYYYGFGDCESECFTGLNDIVALTVIPQQLKVEMKYHNEPISFQCGFFQVSGDSNRLHISKCQHLDGLDTSDLVFHDGMAFSFGEGDSADDCADWYGGGWWYNTDNNMDNADCHRFHPTGTYGSREYGKGINFASLTGYTDSLEELRLSICGSRMIDFATSEDYLFVIGDETVLSCPKDCSRYLDENFQLEDGYQVFVYSKASYDGSLVHVFTGPIEDGTFTFDGAGPSEFSFFITVIDKPVIFSLTDFEFESDELGNVGMKYLRSTCKNIQTCGWSGPVKSLIIPKGYTVDFFDNPLDSLSTGGEVWTASRSQLPFVSFDVKAWIVRRANEAMKVRIPVLYETDYFSGRGRQLHYSCVQDCGVQHYQSLSVPENYIVKLYNKPNHDESGVYWEVIGPQYIEQLDGLFMKDVDGYVGIMSYTSEKNAIEAIQIVYKQFYVDQVTDVKDETVAVTKFVIENPTASPRETEFTDTYVEVTEEIIQDFLEKTDEDVYVETWSENTGWTYSKEEHFDVGAEGTWSKESGGGGTIPAAKYTISGTIRGSYGRTSTGTDSGGTEGSISDTVRSTTTKKTGGSITTRTEESKTFRYICFALPFTRTECIAYQTVVVGLLPFDAEKRILYKNGLREIVEFSGMMEVKKSTEVFFGVDEYSIRGFCKEEGFTQYNEDCYKAIIKDNELGETKVAFEEAEDLCFESGGSSITSVSNDVENYYVRQKCIFEGGLTGGDSMLLGIMYNAETGAHTNMDGTQFSGYHRFRKDVQTPTVDSYVVLDNYGRWDYVPMDIEISTSDCVVCKKDVSSRFIF